MHLHKDDRSLTCRTMGLRLERCVQRRIRIEKVFLFIAQASKDSHVFSPSKSTRNLSEYHGIMVPYSSLQGDIDNSHP